MADLIQSISLLALCGAFVVRELLTRRFRRKLELRLLRMENEQAHVFNWQKRTDPLLKRWLL